MLKIVYGDISFCKTDSDLSQSYNDFSLERAAYVKSIKDDKKRQQSFYVWKLLVKILKENFDKDFEIGVIDGKWYDISGSVNFSLSHSNNIVAVAVSDEVELSIDVEMISDKILQLKNNCKYKHIQPNKRSLTTEWTKNECKIKSVNVNEFYHFYIDDEMKNEYVLTVGLNVDKNKNHKTENLPKIEKNISCLV